MSVLFCRILLARLEYLRDTFQIKEGDFLTFDALVSLHCLLYHLRIICLAFSLYVSDRFEFSNGELTGAETSCSMCRPSHPLKSRLWHDDIC